MPNDTLVIWDWDDTLIDATPLFIETYKELTKAFPCEWFQEDRSDLLLKDWVTFWKTYPRDDRRKAVEFYDETYVKLMQNRFLVLLNGAKEVLSFFKEKGVTQILVSNKTDWILKEEVKTLGMESFFDLVMGTKKEEPQCYKPQEVFSQKIASLFSHKNKIAIGDKLSDMLFAQQLGARAFLVYSKSQTPHQQLKTDVPFCAIDSLNELKEIYQPFLQENFKNSI